jgi:hypothetical protein
MNLHGRLKALEQHPGSAGDEEQAIEIVEVGADGSESLSERIYWRHGSDLLRSETYRDGKVVKAEEWNRTDPMRWDEEGE